MTELLTGVEAPSDAELISRVRGGDVAAYGELFTRHVDAARRLGRQLVRGPDVDDLVSDAFAKTLTVLQHGGGPDVAFRAYLLTSVRRLHVDKIRAAKKVQPADDMTVFDDGVPFRDTAVADFESGAAAKAFASLPERWQLVLWHLEVEGQKPADIAPLLGMSANSVSALAYRAREGLRQAFLTMHLADSPTEQCRWVNEHLGAYVRKGLSKRDTAKVEEHLDGCRRCTAMYLELDEVNSNLAGIIGPLLLGAAAAGYASSAGGAGATSVSALFGRVRDAVSGNGSAGAGSAGTTAGSSAAAAGTGAAVTSGGLVTAGGVIAASVAAITAAAFIFGGGADKEVLTEADQPFGIVQTPGPPADSESAGADEPESNDEERVESLESLDDATDTDALSDGEDTPGDASDGLPFGSAFDGTVVDPGSTADAPAAPPAAPADNPATPGADAPAAPGADTPPAPAPGDTTDDPADEPGTTPGEAAPGDEPGSEPGTDDPSAEQPGSEQPGTETPPTEQPGVENPPPGGGPQQPSEGSDDETDGNQDEDDTSGGGDTSDDGVASITATVSAAGIVDGSLEFALSSDGDLPPHVIVTLTSDPTGITIDSAQLTSSQCDALDSANLSVSCFAVPDGAAAGSFAMPAVADAVALSRISIPLDVSDAVDGTVVSFTVTPPDGWEFKTGSTTGGTVVYEAPDDGDGDGDGDTDFDFDGVPVITDMDNRLFKRVELRFTGVGEGGTLKLQLSGGTAGQSHTFESADTCALDEENKVATCVVPEGTTTHSVTFVVKSPGEGKTISLLADFAGVTLPPVPLTDPGN